MATLVVDASIAVKWFVEEQYFEFARALHSSQVNLCAPTLLVPEIGNAFLKKVRRGELTEQDAGLGLGQVPSMVSLLDTQTLAQDALSIALRYQRSLHDSLYVALAIREQFQLVTADERLYNALRLIFPETMLWIEHVPAMTDDASADARVVGQ